MKLKLSALILSLLSCVGAMAASSGTCGDNITWSLDDAGVLTLTGTGNMTDYAYSDRSPWGEAVKSVNIAEGITSIGAYAFYHCADLTEVSMPKSVTVINKCAFEACTSLAAITLGEGVTSIALSTFEDCTALTSVTFPKVLKSIGDYAFDGCSMLTGVVIPDAVTLIGDGAFNNCKEITEITIPELVTRLGGNAFANCTKLASVTFNAAECTYMGSTSRAVFAGCPALTSVTFGDKVTMIPAYAFNHSRGLTAVKLPKSVTEIGMSAFIDCQGVTEVSLGNSLTTIGEYAFAGCKNFATITFPETLTSIGGYAFSECSALTKIESLATVPPTLGSKVFSDFNTAACYLMVTQEGYEAYRTADQWKEFIVMITMGKCGVNINWSLDDDKNLTLTGIGEMYDYNISDNKCPWGTAVKSVKITKGITSIGNAAFYGCANLYALNIPETITAIGDHAFAATGLFEITSQTSTPPTLGSGVFADVDVSECVLVIPNEGAAAYRTADQWKDFAKVTTVGRCGDNITWSLDCDDILTLAGSGEMYDYNFDAPWGASVKSIIIADGITSFGKTAFYGCADIVNIFIPKSVSSIGEKAFAGCAKLATVVSMATTPPMLGAGVFEGVNTASAKLTVPEESIEAYRAADQWKDFGSISGAKMCGDNITWSLDDAGVLTLIGTGNMTDYAYSDRSPWGETVKSVNIAEGITSIGAYALYHCADLTEVSMPKSVTVINKCAFEACTSLAAITLGEGVTSIAQSAFEECSALTSVTLPKVLKSIGDYAFNNCKEITEITIPEPVTRIGGNAFANCTKLASVTFNAAECSFMSSSSRAVFAGCPALTSVTFGDKVTMIPAYAFNHSRGLTAVKLPNSVTEIGMSAFIDCQGVTEVSLGNSLTTIGDYAFAGCKNFATITFPETLTSIGSYAFDECSALTKAESLATVPPTLGTKVFANIDIAACTLLVPEGCTDAYRAADQWKDFGTITTGVNDIAADNTDFSVDVINGEIIVSGAPADALMSVYSVSGACLYHGIIKPQSVPAPGIYIIRIASRALKLSVK